VLDQLFSQHYQGTPLVAPHYEDRDVCPILEPALQAIWQTLVEEEQVERTLPETLADLVAQHGSLSASLIILTQYSPSTLAGHTICAPKNKTMFVLLGKLGTEDPG
jgi:hypothetical protein